MTRTLSRRTAGEITYLIVIVCTLLLRVAIDENLPEKMGADSSVFFTCIVQLICFGVVPFSLWYFLRSKPANHTIGTLFYEFNFKKPSFRDMLRSFGIGVAMIYLATMLSVFWSMVLREIGFVYSSSQTEYTSVGVLLSELALTALLPAVFEEFTHRGLLFACYRDSGWKVVLLSALLFSLMHQNIRQTGYTFFDGLVIALIVYYSGSIFPAIFVHFLNNAVSVLWGYGDYTGGWLSFMGKISDWLYGSLLGYVVGAILAVVAVGVMVLLFYRMRKDAVAEGRLEDTIFAGGDVGARPIYKSALFYITVAVGVAATAFTFAWGLMR